MLSLVLVGSWLAVAPPALPGEPVPIEPAVEPAPAVETASVPEAAPVVEAAPVPEAAPEPDPITVDAIIVAPPPPEPPASDAALPPGVVVIDTRPLVIPRPAPAYVVPPPPWSGSGRFVGGAVMMLAGTGLLVAATLEYADGRDTTQPVISHVPAGISMLVAGGVMLGTGIRDQRSLGEWEAATGIDARPNGNGLIVAGVTATTLGAMAAVATSIAVDQDLDAPRSIPAGWATAGVAMGGGVALLVAGIVRSSRYGKWRTGLRGVPMVTPSRAGASVGFVGQF